MMTEMTTVPKPDGEEMAIVLRDVTKSYKSFLQTPTTVLTNVNMTVRKGTIYGLLGPSGCGKTTMLRCIVGRLSVKSGNISAFGFQPGTPESNIPGKRVGYMPQDIALYIQLSIEETMQYFGRLLDMKESKVKERTKFLVELLQLPDKNRLVRELSGGQQRRVSFASALLHEPELLILDEPTVGVDPLLRKTIWEHLFHIAENFNTTIIITTHYIEEARHAHTVGLMRAGRLLVEASPDHLLERHSKENLEDVFLKICCQDNEKKLIRRKSSLKLAKQNRSDESLSKILDEDYDKQKTKKQMRMRMYCSMPKKGSIKAIAVKNLLRVWRNPGHLVFQFIIPTVQIVLFIVTFGALPSNLPLATVNHDNGTQQFGSLFLNHLDSHVIKQKNFSNIEDACQLAKSGKAWGCLEIGRNFSDSMKERFDYGHAVSPEALDGSQVHINLDTTNHQVYLSLKYSVINAFQNFYYNAYLNSTDIPNANHNFSKPIVNFDKSIYGTFDTARMTDFITPAVLLGVIYIMELGLTALLLVMERKEGLLDRSWVAGMSATEIVLGYALSETLIIFIQAALVVTLTIGIFQLHCNGPIELIIGLVILHGYCGMSYGLLVSAICEDEKSAAMVGLGSFMPNLILTGMVWPIESIPWALRYFGYILPQTIPTEAVRAIMLRGWGYNHSIVLYAYLITIGWTIAHLFFAGLATFFRK